MNLDDWVSAFSAATCWEISLIFLWLSLRVSRCPENRIYRRLTRQETEVLRLLSRPMTNEQISQVMYLELTTVKKHVGKILKKLQVNDRHAAAQIAQSLDL